MATTKSEPIDPTIVHPEPDTSANEGVDGGPPPTWDPGKVTQVPVVAEDQVATENEEEA